MAASSKRLFVGNLGETVDEYALLTELRKHGKISKFDYLFHKSGPKQGRPRGYAFVEYETKEEALRTMIELDGKPLRGRKLAIKRANEAPTEYTNSSTSGPWRTSGQKHTTLSLLKGHTKPESRDSKISALEAKLQALEAEKTASDNSRQASASISEAEGGTPEPQGDPEAGPSTLPSSSLPASLPAKPQLSSLPPKPDSNTITRGEKEQRIHKDQEEGKRADQQQQHHHHRDGRRNDRGKKPQEVPKATLASLGASMSK